MFRHHATQKRLNRIRKKPSESAKEAIERFKMVAREARRAGDNPENYGHMLFEYMQLDHAKAAVCKPMIKDWSQDAVEEVLLENGELIDGPPSEGAYYDGVYFAEEQARDWHVQLCRRQKGDYYRQPFRRGAKGEGKAWWHRYGVATENELV